jgi:hypothetical protein
MTPRNTTVTGDVVRLTAVNPAAGLVIDENTLTPFSTVLIVAVGQEDLLFRFPVAIKRLANLSRL